ncbi:hypothetical protein M422DRAFT_265927 [Sphaerobolus stellatus SS14]|uniref:Uncharacterized protein n=1 Tax=Sphaerobolus stellatus (strain SS14) TaxID=990650 RepID=A0A0C9V438_SPHS4|nr:hypothetical protein M422DRAFT_265927 [Sphaerobolus stellatus SS14]
MDSQKGPNLARINKPEINLPATKLSVKAERFRSHFTLKPKLPKLDPPSTANSPVQHAVVLSTSINLTNEDSDLDGEGYCGYLLELSDGDSDYAWEDEEEDLPGESNPINPASLTSLAPSINFQVRAPPPLKHQKLDVPAREARVIAKEATVLKQQEAWVAIQKLITSKKDLFESGRNGLQEYRACAIESCLQMMVKNGRKLMDTSERAAESQGFAKNWGGRMVRSWVRLWIKSRELPTSKRGRHSKWSMNPKKLVEFTKNKLFPDEAKRYLQCIVETEMPSGLKKYLELELFPRIQVKVSKGISLRTARRWLHKEGFKYTAHKKALYFDGHEREVPRLVKYIVGDVDRLVKKPLIPGEPRLVLVAHDEMTAQAHDGVMMSWVWQGEQPLKKKGAGRGLHQSDFICPTVGWLKEASKTLEYGKNYDGFWNGELFVKQLKEDFALAFEKAHGLGVIQHTPKMLW